MDVYGCSSSWRMNRPTEFPQPGCSQWSSPYPPELPAERHVMSPPSPSPWSSAGLSWGTQPAPPLMHFTANTTKTIHCKRKPSQSDLMIPAKQFITEEKMAAHLSGLHISRDYTEHGEPEDKREMRTGVGAAGWGGRTVVLAEEIKKIQHEPLIPASLLERLEKPCMSLMVWQPKEPPVSREDEDRRERERRKTGVLVADSVAPDESMDIEM